MTRPGPSPYRLAFVLVALMAIPFTQAVVMGNTNSRHAKHHSTSTLRALETLLNDLSPGRGGHHTQAAASSASSDVARVDRGVPAHDISREQAKAQLEETLHQLQHDTEGDEDDASRIDVVKPVSTETSGKHHNHHGCDDDDDEWCRAHRSRWHRPGKFEEDEPVAIHFTKGEGKKSKRDTHALEDRISSLIARLADQQGDDFPSDEDFEEHMHPHLVDELSKHHERSQKKEKKTKREPPHQKARFRKIIEAAEAPDASVEADVKDGISEGKHHDGVFKPADYPPKHGLKPELRDNLNHDGEEESEAEDEEEEQHHRHNHHHRHHHHKHGDKEDELEEDLDRWVRLHDTGDGHHVGAGAAGCDCMSPSCDCEPHESRSDVLMKRVSQFYRWLRQQRHTAEEEEKEDHPHLWRRIQQSRRKQHELQNQRDFAISRGEWSKWVKELKELRNEVASSSSSSSSSENEAHEKHKFRTSDPHGPSALEQELTKAELAANGAQMGSVSASDLARWRSVLATIASKAAVTVAPTTSPSAPAAAAPRFQQAMSPAGAAAPVGAAGAASRAAGAAVPAVAAVPQQQPVGAGALARAAAAAAAGQPGIATPMALVGVP